MQFFTPDPLFKNNKSVDGIITDKEGRPMRTSPRKEHIARILAFSKALEIQKSRTFGNLEVVVN